MCIVGVVPRRRRRVPASNDAEQKSAANENQHEEVEEGRAYRPETGASQSVLTGTETSAGALAVFFTPGSATSGQMKVSGSPPGTATRSIPHGLRRKVALMLAKASPGFVFKSEK